MTAKIVGAITLPAPITDLAKQTKLLTKEHGKGLVMAQVGQKILVATPGDPSPLSCWCIGCETQRAEWFELFEHMPRMIVCPDCGNKRCPRATSHDLDCTGSNLPGQTGSVYGHPQTCADVVRETFPAANLTDAMVNHLLWEHTPFPLERNADNLRLFLAEIDDPRSCCHDGFTVGVKGGLG